MNGWRGLACGWLLAMMSLAWAAMPSNTVYLPADGRAAGVPAALAAARRQGQQRARTLEAYRQALVRRHAVSPRAVLPRFDTFVLPAAPRTTPATRATRLGNGALAFTYEGWTAAERTALGAFVDEAYPVLVSLYGAPASGSAAAPATLRIIKSGAQETVEGGEFDPAAMTLRIGPLPEDFTAGDYTFYGMNLLHLLLHAFHVPAIIGFDAWEEGMARATAVVAITQLRPETEIIYAMDYVLPLYDALNQPPLATANFFPAQGIPQLSLWRVAMANAAWLKVYAESRTAFRTFHEAYYAHYAANPATASNLETLKGLMAAAVGSVEGAPFLDWYDRQHVLRPIVTLGKTLFLYPVPLQDNISLQIYHYQANADGSQVPLAATAKLEYYSFDNLPLYPEEGDEAAISATGQFPGIGFINPSFYNIGDTPTQRIRINVVAGGLSAVTYYAYWSRGDDDNEREFWGPIIGADEGTLRIYVPGINLPATQVIQGAFYQDLPTGDISFLSPVIFEYTPAGPGATPITLRRNVGPGFYMPVLTVADPTNVTLTHTFARGLRLVSFPITPHEPDAGVLFGFPAESPYFKLAWWDPSRAGDNKYRYYPATPTPAPGRGYWVDLASNTTVAIQGRVPAADDPRVLTLLPGWNQIGNTFNAVLNPWAMEVESGSTSMALVAAVRMNIVSPVWTYGTDGYYIVGSTLKAWEGGWINNTTGGTLRLRQSGAAQPSRAVVDPTRLLGEGGWGVNLRARDLTSEDAMLYLGVSTAAQAGVDGLDWPKPPPAAGMGIRTAFIHPSARTAGASYATDLRRAISAGGDAWEFEVTSRTASPVTVSWPDLRGVPARYQLILEDLVSGERQYMRTTSAYQFTATGTTERPDIRRFRVTILPKGQTVPLNFVSITTPTARSAGLRLQVTMNAPADLTMEVRTATGKLLRTLRSSATRANDPVTFVWDGHARDGKLTPTGTYMLTLTAKNAEGYTIRRAQLVQLGR